MLLTNQSLKSQIKFQVPWFYNQSYPLFVKFLEYYYEWMETLDKDNAYGVLAILDNYKKIKDIDSTLDELIPLFKTTYFRSIPETTKVERRVFIKRIIDIYRVKGTRESLNLLFTIILGETPDLYYPRTFLAKSSFSPFVSTFFIYFLPLDSNFNYYELKGDTVTLGLNSREIIVSSIYKVSSIYQFILDIDKEEKKTLESETFLYYKGIEIGTLFPLLSSLTIKSSSKHQRKNKIFSLYNTTSISPAICSIDSIRKGKIDSFIINSRGEGYAQGDVFVSSDRTLDFEASVSQVNNFGEIVEIIIKKNNFITDVIPPIISLSETGKNASIDWFSSSHKNVERVSVLDSGIGILSSGALCSLSGIQFSYETSFIGSRSEFSDTTNLLGGKKILQDNFLYQNFSYVIAYSAPQSEFPEVEIRDLIHSPGFLLFTRKDIESVSSSELNSSVEQSTAPYMITVIIEGEDLRNSSRRNTPLIKYTNDTPIQFVSPFNYSGVDSFFCFETKADISQKDFDIVTPSSIDGIITSLTNTINFLL